MSSEAAAVATLALIRTGPTGLASQGVTAPIYDQDEVPPIGSRPSPYAVLSLVQRRYGEGARLSDQKDLEGFRAVTMFVGRTATEARSMEAVVTKALEGHRITVNGFLSGKFHCETSTGITRDPTVDDFYQGTTTWTSVFTKQSAA